jgi:hypothetical protein
MEIALLLYCAQHYQQVSSTPFGHGQLAHIIGRDGLTDACKSILQGTLFENYGIETFPELDRFITQLAIPMELKGSAEKSTEITVDEYRHKVDEYRHKIKKWKEATSTSPSGCHLGIYKALLQLPRITDDMCKMLNVVTRTGLVPRCWCNAVSVLLETDSGAPNINRLRVIHLFEADNNIFLKVMWADRLVTHGENHKPIWRIPARIKKIQESK